MKPIKLILAAALSLTAISTFAWQPYAGINAALSQGTFKNKVSNPYQYGSDHSGSTSNPIPPYYFNGSTNTVLPGVRLGISNQYNKTYLGFEADIAYDNSTYTTKSIVENVTGLVTNSFSNDVSSKLQWQYTLAAQLGYFITPNLMPYGRLGITAAQANTSYNYIDLPSAGVPTAFNAFNSNTKDWLFGPTIGIGAQYSLSKHLRAFAEADYTYLTSNGSTSTAAHITPSGASIDGLSNIPNFNQKFTFTNWSGVLGVNYYF